jgi:alanyl aminopeptidase
MALKPLTHSKTSEVATAPLGLLAWIYRDEAVTDAQRARVRAWIEQAYLPRLEQLGYTRKAGEADGDALLRSTLASALAFDFEVPQVRAALLKQGDAALAKKADGRLDLGAADPDLLGDALGVAVQAHGKRAVDALIAELPKTTDPALRNGVLDGLSAVQDPQLADEARDFALSKDVRWARWPRSCAAAATPAPSATRCGAGSPATTRRSSPAPAASPAAACRCWPAAAAARRTRWTACRRSSSPA